MSFRGGFRGRFGGGGRGSRFFGGRGGGGRASYAGPPEQVVEAGHFSHDCEGEAVCKLTNEKIPYFNAPIYLENKAHIGKVEEIFGLVNNSYFTIKMNEGVVANSYSEGGGRGGAFRGGRGSPGGRFGRGGRSFRGSGRGRGGFRGGFRGRR